MKENFTLEIVINAVKKCSPCIKQTTIERYIANNVIIRKCMDKIKIGGLLDYKLKIED